MLSDSEKTIISPQIFHKCLGSTLSLSEEIHEAYIEPRFEEILAYSGNNLPHEGTLSLDDRGYFFLSVVNSYIFDLCLLLNRKEIDLPPYFLGNFKAGAHITVALPQEKKSLYKLPEIGESIPFSITGCFYTRPQNLSSTKKVWFLTIDSPEIEKIRVKMGLSPLPLDQNLHITFAEEKQFLSLEDFLSVGEDMSISMRPLKITKDKIRKILEHPNYTDL